MQTMQLSAFESNRLVALYNAKQYVQLESYANALIDKYPESGFAWKLLGIALRMQGKEALHALQKSAALSSTDPDALCHLAIAQKEFGLVEDAVTTYRNALILKPDYALIYNNLGNIFRELGQIDRAFAIFHRALAIQPNFALAHNNLGNAWKEINRIDDAISSYRLALKNAPSFLEVLCSLGDCLKTQGDITEAENCYRQAIATNSGFADASIKLASLQKEQGKFSEAETSIKRLLQAQPHSSIAHYALGSFFLELGRLVDAESSYRTTLQIKPDHAEAYCNLGVALQMQYRLDEAIASCERALQINSNYAKAHNNLGNILKEVGRLDEALACYNRAMEIEPQNTTFHSNLIYSLSFHATTDAKAILAEANRFAAKHCTVLAQEHLVQRNPRRAQDRRLRIGYVSPDFRNHCQSLFTIPLLSNHDHTQFEIYCYANVVQPDEFTKRISHYADEWRYTQMLTDAQLADVIARDEIDILVDLTMHMAYGRPMLFARKPAPLQVAWLAYPGTTGIPEMDYRLTDPWLDPLNHNDDLYTEKSVRLTDTFWCYSPANSNLHPNALPALKNGYITFGCLNNFCKVTKDTVHRWGRVMQLLPTSRLILLAPIGKHRQTILRQLEQYDVGVERVEFVEYMPRDQYLKTYHRIDICLDTLPANGHTTSLDAFWMGVPVVTKVGDTVVGRAGWSQLNNLGLPELASFDDQSFVEACMMLATDLSRLSQLRSTLRTQMEAGPLMDGKRFARAMEGAYHQIWKDFCANSTAGAEIQSID